MVIGIAGHANSGKDTLGCIIKEIRNEFKIVKYADRLKELTALLIGCTREDLEDREFKETPLGEEWWIYDCKILGKRVILSYKDTDPSYISQIEHTLIKVSPRWLLQNIGTDCFREMIHPNTWVNSTFANYNDSENWIITDVRFENEANMIKSKGGYLIRVIRDVDSSVPMHRSETELDTYQGYDLVINNDGSVEDLRSKIKNIINSLC